MLSYEKAQWLYHQIKEKASKEEDFEDFYALFCESAVDYAALRTHWSLLTPFDRRAKDRMRSIYHDAFMDKLAAVCRALDLSDTDALLPDRKTKGDFACYLSLFLALEQR